MEKIKMIKETDVEKVKDILDLLYTDCELAILNEWDRCDDGFMAMQHQIEKAGEALGLEIESKVEELKG